MTESRRTRRATCRCVYPCQAHLIHPDGPGVEGEQQPPRFSHLLPPRFFLMYSCYYRASSLDNPSHSLDPLWEGENFLKHLWPSRTF